MYVTKQHIRAMRWIRRRTAPAYRSVCKKFGRVILEELIGSGFVQPSYLDVKKDADGFDTEPQPDSIKVRLTNKGLAEVESHDWFNGEYALAHILIPIAIGVASTLLTLFLRGVLFPSL